jgi:hypothetical protein
MKRWACAEPTPFLVSGKEALSERQSVLNVAAWTLARAGDQSPPAA